jgi:2-oxoacid:acceptor oxidoreductase delta subunit (pyruvate/2-ketoisovalerate family)
MAKTDLKPEEVERLAREALVAVSFGTMMVNRTGSWRYMRPVYHDKISPCNEGCPAGENIERYMVYAAQGRFREAWETIRQENPLPGICGRVCYHPCEGVCNRKFHDEGLAINDLERAIFDYGRAPLKEIKELPTKYPEKVAIVGAGPAGLAGAYHLRRLGYEVTVYEAHSKAGGVLRLGIPEYRLPRDVLDLEIAQIEALGVRIETGCRVGSDITFEKLAQDHCAIFAATGVHVSRPMGVKGENLDGVLSGLGFLKKINTGETVKIGKRVSVIGGGNTAMDVARTALRLGSEVTVLYRRTRVEMPAHPVEVDEGLEEGVDIKFLTAPLEVIGDANGRVTGVRCQQMKLGEPDDSGRRRPVPVEGSDFVVATDNVFSAIGEMPDFSYLPENVKHDDWVVKIDSETGAASNGTVFAGGDIIEIPHMVVTAIGSGKRSALAIHAQLRGEDVKPVYEKIKIGHKGSLAVNDVISPPNGDEGYLKSDHVVSMDDINPFYFKEAARNKMPHLSPEERKVSFKEVNLGVSQETAIQEASRCFNCGICNGCDNCFVFCPDSTIHRKDGKYWVNYDHCKGCGVCVTECPRSALSLEAEEKWRRK